MPILLLVFSAYPYITRVCKFGCVTDQIGQYLLKLTRCRPDNLRHIISYMRSKRNIAHACLESLYIKDRIYDLPEVSVLRADPYLIKVGLCEVDDVVNDLHHQCGAVKCRL